jgi:hypothetical protein
MHNTEKHSRVELGIDTTKKHVDPKEWMAAFITIKHSLGESRDTLLKLAVTPVQVFGDEWFVDSESTKMTSSSVTNFWIGACQLAGSPWTARMDQSTNDNSLDTTAKANDSMDASPIKTAPKKDNLSYKQALTSNVKAPPKPILPETTPGSIVDKGASFGAGVKS